jgi:flagellar biosynthesis/type III secretory pathway chaperone
MIMNMEEIPEPLEVLVDELRHYSKICDEVHAVVSRENQFLKSSEPESIHQFQKTRQELLERLTGAQMRIAVHKVSWLRVPPAARAKRPEIGHLIRQTLDLIMKTIVLDRENEQLLLRHQMVPANRLPPAHRQNPAWVSKLYQGGRSS